MIVILPFVVEFARRRNMIWSLPFRNRISRRRKKRPKNCWGNMPLPSDAKTFFLGGIFVLSMLAAGYVASEIVLPLIFAVMLNLLMQPALRALEGSRVPRALGALLLILVVIATIVGLGAAVAGPAEAWMAKLPEGIPRILERLRSLDAPINILRTFLAAANSFGAAGSQRSSPGPFDGGAIISSVFSGTRSFASGLFTTVMFLYFLLVSGDSFLRRLVEVLPRFASKRQAVDISQQIGRDISVYLLTITLMNALVGAATALVMWSTGVGDPVLWGTVALFSIMCRFSGPPQPFSSSYSPARLRSLRPGRPCSQRRSMAPSI
jgi:predicted PurR-regulated permease PerM